MTDRQNSPRIDLPPEMLANLKLAIDFARRRIPLLKEIGGLQEDLKSINSEAKELGVQAKHIKLAEQMILAEEEDALVEDMKVRAGLMKLLDFSFGHQFDLFSKDSRPDDERAFHAGFSSSIKGESLFNPFAAHLPQANSYADGWHAGQAERRTALQASMEAKNATAEIKAIKQAEQQGGGDTPSQDQIDALRSGARLRAAA
jgi:hypothetical protein